MTGFTEADYRAQNWVIDKTNTQFVRYGDVIEFAKAGKLFRVRVIRGDYTVAVGAATFVDGSMDASFVGRVGTKTVPFVDVRFELVKDKPDGPVRLKFKLTPTYDGGVMPDQGGSGAGSGSSSGGGH